MGIRRLVAEFTTPYSCCQPRVTNIQRAAEILDGEIVVSGGRFSLNQRLGERTAERGFVSAPMITAGRLEDAVGGGVSQIATTVYNAAFFAGLELIAHTPHQFYISRYPMGREATVSWGGPELIFRNDWPAAILVKVEAGDTSVTVRFYSSKLGRRVETETGQPYAYTSARTIREYNPSLPAGTEEVVQSGGISGFTVQYTRTVLRNGKVRRDERFTVRYDPEHTIVEYGPPPSSGKDEG
jgi:vancomycin resistance protein YoaR